MERKEGQKEKKSMTKQLKDLLTKDFSSKRQLTLEISDNEAKGLIVFTKSGVINVEEAFRIQEPDTLNSSQTVVSEQLLTTIKEKVAYHKTGRTGITIAFTSLGAVEKVVKLPPLDTKTIHMMLQDNYTKFFTSVATDSIQGTERLGDSGKKQGEVYYFISTIPKLPIISLSTQLDKRKIRIDTIYNEVLALRNVLLLFDRGNPTKCLVYMRQDKVQLIVTHNNTLIFHKTVELNQNIASTVEDLSVGYGDVWSNTSKEAKEEKENNTRLTRVYSTLTWVANTIEYINQKTNVTIEKVFVAGDYLKVPNATTLLTSELGVEVEQLNVRKEEETAKEVVNWTYDSLEDDYLIPFGLALRGVVT